MKSPRPFARWSTLVALLVLSSCGSPPRELVGKVETTDAFIGLVVNQDRVVGYVCDGTDATVSLSIWFSGAVSKDAFDITAAGVRFVGTVASGKVATGTVTLTDGSTHAFSTEVATPPAGVYADTTSFAGDLFGWIVLNDGSARGAVKSISTGFTSPVGGTTVSTSGITATVSGVQLSPVRVTSPAPPTAVADAGTCSAASTCSGHGTCTSSGACACATGFSGANCNFCAANFFGYPSCTACTAASTCNGHGACTSSGACACDAAFTGASCSACSTDHYAYPTCKFCSAATTCSGHGTCDSTGSCVCNPGFSGPSCN